ncbi:MAG: protein-glutamate O-methyltransferase CheR, partial [Zymomonas sp.]
MDAALTQPPGEADNEPVEDIEIHLLLEALYRRYHYDFRHYARA